MVVVYENLNQMLLFFLFFFLLQETLHRLCGFTIKMCPILFPAPVLSKPSTCQILVKLFLLSLFWCHGYAVRHGGFKRKCTKWFQTYFKHNLHSVCWFAWDGEQHQPINHSQVWHSYLPFPYQLGQEELRPSPRTLQSATFRWLFELNL